MTRGEIWWATLPEPSGRRPVVLLSRNAFYRTTAHIVIAEVTTTIRLLESEVALGKGDGLDRACVINTAQLWTVRQDAFDSQITSLSAAKRAALDAALSYTLGLS
jgi:mRNA interferase MazF